LLDSGCGTYALSRSFAESNRIEIIPTPPIPLELAEETEDIRVLQSQTNPIQIRLGATKVYRSFYILDQGCHDVIFGWPFFRFFTPQFDWETHKVKIAGENHALISPTKGPMAITVAVISRAKLKSIIRRNDTEEIYVGLVKPISEPTGPDSSDDQPSWITTEFSDVFMEGLPPELPPSRAVDHEIPILPDLVPPFRAIFRLAQSELKVLKETIDKLLSEGKINPSTSPYGAWNLQLVQKLVEGMAIDPESLPKEGYPCEACILGSQTRNLSDAPMTRCTVPGDRIHSDICGWITPIALEESRYILIFIEDATRMTYLFVIKSKTAQEVRECFLKFRNIFERDGRRIKSIRTHDGGEYRKQMADLCTETGIHHEETAPYAPEQNGVAERANRTL
jgi:Integrase core domain